MYNEELIKQVRQGRLAILNDGTREELDILLRYCFPQDPANATGCRKYYKTHICGNKQWQGNDNVAIPHKSVKEFIQEEFVLPELWYVKPNNLEEAKILAKYFYDNKCGLVKNFKYYLENVNGVYEKGLSNDGYGLGKALSHKEITFEQFKKYVLKENNMKEKEIIGYKLIKPEYREVARLIHPYGQYLASDKLISSYGDPYLPVNDNTTNAMRKAGVLDIWFEPVYKKDKKLPDINGYKGELLKDNVTIKYGCAEFDKYFFECLDKANKAGINKKIKSIKLDSGVEITIEQIKEIVEYLNTLK